ncbi:hypothetical protein BDP27DRAFT_1328181 [Rhodocollybia butyracea]|uniref:Uncharacterized protein n=1 Tax=Rhodocollybia butyracea TaxID=206335 RepID=A0A9P5PRI0_9AGAR|nr:hypothetical protein BDP27DRAFT_1328181 [Rhodocollybia butyracea]
MAVISRLSFWPLCPFTPSSLCLAFLALLFGFGHCHQRHSRPQLRDNLVLCGYTVIIAIAATSVPFRRPWATYRTLTSAQTPPTDPVFSLGVEHYFWVMCSYTSHAKTLVTLVRTAHAQPLRPVSTVVTEIRCITLWPQAFISRRAFVLLLAARCGGLGVGTGGG